MRNSASPHRQPHVSPYTPTSSHSHGSDASRSLANTVLCSAAVQGQSEVIRVLVAAGADTDLKVCRDGGKGGATHDASPLLLAVVGGHLEAARVLLEGG